MILPRVTTNNIINILKNGGIGVLPTDTIYGLVGKALLKETVERAYRLKGRSASKPFIILISSLRDLNLFNIKLDKKNEEFLKKIWPNPVSVILTCNKKELAYLHRNTNSLAFRMPNNKSLLELIEQTGPLIAPSANKEGQCPAQTLEEANNYFGDNIDFYANGGKLSFQPSTLIKIVGGKVIILREGAFLINNPEDLWM